MDFIKNNWFKLFIVIVACFLIYWSFIRVNLIKKSCAVWALEKARTTESGTKTIDGKYIQKQYDNYYKRCLREKGA